MKRQRCSPFHNIRTILLGALIICLVMPPIFAMGAQAASSQERGGADEEVRMALQKLKFAYASRDVMRMMSCLDNKYPGRLEFNAAVQNYFLNHKELEILFYQDTVLEDRNMVNARVRWYKRAFTLAGVFQKTEGQCQLGFVRTGRAFKLYYIRGANPFF